MTPEIGEQALEPLPSGMYFEQFGAHFEAAVVIGFILVKEVVIDHGFTSAADIMDFADTF